MSYNVQCTRVFIAAKGTPFATPRKCKWKGERFGGNRNLGPLPADEFYRQLHARMVAKPCPRCGGRVELIERAP